LLGVGYVFNPTANLADGSTKGLPVEEVECGELVL